MKFADKLASLRKANNLSQEQLADKLDVSRQSISKWESGDTYPDMAKMIQICEILNCTLPELMDDGTFPEDYKPKEDKGNSISAYLKSFLDYVTKTYNMFIHMTTKSKLVCLIEMLFIGVIITIGVKLFPELLNVIIDRLFRYLPYGYTISNIISDIVTVILGIVGVIVFFHLFKIRYLDYYVTVTDNNVEEQTVEEPIEENISIKTEDKTKMIIRDPKHSISHFLDGIAKILLFIFKILVIMWSIPALCAAIGGTYLSAIMLINSSYSSIFVFAGIACIGVAIVGYILVYMAINYIFKREQPYKILIIIFMASLLMIGTGAGLATNKALDIKIVDSSYNQKLIEDKMTIKQEDIEDDMILDFCTSRENVNVIINDSKTDIDVIVERPDYVYVVQEDYWDHYYSEPIEGGQHCKQFSFASNQNFREVLKDIKEDIKNGYFRKTYDNAYSLVKVKVVLSSDTLKRIVLLNWGE